ncbi:MAG TPA: hypothetical protein VN700_07960 [Vicinamibacterales bacterium]|nr:hypothetical protein [Vicinamibacterales bacterium]
MSVSLRLPRFLSRRVQVAVPAQQASATFAAHELPRCGYLAVGHGAALVEKDTIQDVVMAHARPEPLDRLRTGASKSADAFVCVWLFRPVCLALDPVGVVSRDGHSFLISLGLSVRFAERAHAGDRFRTLPASLADVSNQLWSPIAAALRAAARDVDGEALFSRWPTDTVVSELVCQAAQATGDGVLSTVGPAEIGLRNPFFESQREQHTDRSTRRGELALLEEDSRIRGAVRVLVHQERLINLQRDAEFEAVATTLGQDAELRARALRKELQREDLDAAAERVAAARRSADLVADLVAAVDKTHAAVFESGSRLASALTAAVGSLGAGRFTAHELEWVRSALANAALAARSPEDVLAAIQNGGPLSSILVDPFRRLDGVHSVKPGTRWRVFDGETLWTIAVQQIDWRRCGFLWLRQRPKAARLHIVGKPDGRELRYHVGTEDMILEIHSHRVACRLQSDVAVPTLRFASSA